MTEDEEASDRPAGEQARSKSQIKREMLALQKLGERLAGLRPDVLAGIPLQEGLRVALEDARRIVAHGARRRQMQLIGKLMRSADAHAIRAALERIDSPGREQTRRLHHIEQWRTRLLEQGPEALTAFLAEYPRADRQHLRQLLRRARHEEEHSLPPESSRKLFRYIREVADDCEADEAG